MKSGGGRQHEQQAWHDSREVPSPLNVGVSHTQPPRSHTRETVKRASKILHDEVKLQRELVLSCTRCICDIGQHNGGNRLARLSRPRRLARQGFLRQWSPLFGRTAGPLFHCGCRLFAYSTVLLHVAVVCIQCVDVSESSP